MDTAKPRRIWEWISAQCAHLLSIVIPLLVLLLQPDLLRSLRHRFSLREGPHGYVPHRLTRVRTLCDLPVRGVSSGTYVGNNRSFTTICYLLGPSESLHFGSRADQVACSIYAMTGGKKAKKKSLENSDRHILVECNQCPRPK